LKQLRVTFSDGVSYHIPVDVIARSRASYYAEKDTKMKCGEEYDKVFKEEFDFTMSDNSEIIDWAFNNMNWSNVKSCATVTTPDNKRVNYDKEWTNVEHRIE